MSVLGALSPSVTERQWSKVKETHSGYQLPLGPTNVDRLIRDPKCFGFFLSRYKFAAKMLRRCDSILDIGCGDGIGTNVLLSETDAFTVAGIDFDQKNIDYAKNHLLPAVRALRQDGQRLLAFECRDFMVGDPVRYGGVACMDVIEHIEPSQGDAFIARLAASLSDGAVAVVGTPSLASAPFASEHSRVGHINLYDPDRLRSSLDRSFRQVFMFSMNDEIVHTGFDKLAHYLIGVAVK